MREHVQWIGWRENLQETMVFTIFYMAVSCKFSLKSIHWHVEMKLEDYGLKNLQQKKKWGSEVKWWFSSSKSGWSTSKVINIVKICGWKSIPWWNLFGIGGKWEYAKPPNKQTHKQKTNKHGSAIPLVSMHSLPLRVVLFPSQLQIPCMARVFGFILTGCESTLRFPGGFMNRCPELNFLFIIYIYIYISHIYIYIYIIYTYIYIYIYHIHIYIYIYHIYIHIGFNWETHSLDESKLGCIYVCSIATFVY